MYIRGERMELRDFLIRIKIGTTFGIKKQSQIYQAVCDQLEPSLSEWVHTSPLIADEQRSDLVNYLHSSELKRKIHENEQNGGILTIADPAYPDLLREIYCPPTVLFYRGRLDLLQEPRMVAIVGARNMTRYGMVTVKKLVPGLLEHQLVTVSGLARGVDAMTHQATVDGAGKTIAVIGNGLDVTYPKQNVILQDQVQQTGLLLSEYAQGVRPLRHHFVERNRIIAGLAQATCIIEAKQKSGSLITASLALGENRNVLAVPGSIFNENSRGTNELIAAGARPLISLNDVLEEVGLQR